MEGICSGEHWLEENRASQRQSSSALIALWEGSASLYWEKQNSPWSIKLPWQGDVPLPKLIKMAEKSKSLSSSLFTDFCSQSFSFRDCGDLPANCVDRMASRLVSDLMMMLLFLHNCLLYKINIIFSRGRLLRVARESVLAQLRVCCRLDNILKPRLMSHQGSVSTSFPCSHSFNCKGSNEIQSFFILGWPLGVLQLHTEKFQERNFSEYCGSNCNCGEKPESTALKAITSTFCPGWDRDSAHDLCCATWASYWNLPTASPSVQVK